LLDGLTNNASMGADNNVDHPEATGAVLTGTHPHTVGTNGTNQGASVDQVIAQAMGSDTLFSSLELGAESAAVCTTDWCAGETNISWNGAGSPRVKDIVPASVFERLFGGNNPLETEEQRARRKARKQSIIDFVLEDSHALSARVSASDRIRLDEYLTGVYEIESRIYAEIPSECEDLSWPLSSEGIDEQVKQMCDLMVLAFKCDLTRVITFMLGNGRSDRTVSHIGVSDSHHVMSHHQGDPETIANLNQYMLWQVERFAYLLGEMQKVVTPCGTLLDSSAVCFFSGMGEGDAHRPEDLPVVLAGRACGQLSPGRRLQYSNGRDIADLHVSMMQMFGLPNTTHGQMGTGPLTDL
jgi:hypothetical protein